MMQQHVCDEPLCIRRPRRRSGGPWPLGTGIAPLPYTDDLGLEQPSSYFLEPEDGGAGFAYCERILGTVNNGCDGMLRW